MASLHFAFFSRKAEKGTFAQLICVASFRLSNRKASRPGSVRVALVLVMSGAFDKSRAELCLLPSKSSLGQKEEDTRPAGGDPTPEMAEVAAQNSTVGGTETQGKQRHLDMFLRSIKHDPGLFEMWIHTQRRQDARVMDQEDLRLWQTRSQ
ncbi:unnamed protein product [Effrenium voratum]|nr:unnamed protein product [Effrenium voratum]